MLQYLDPYQYLHVYLRVSHTKNNHNTLGNVRHSKSRDNNFKLPPRAATCRSKRRHGRPPMAVPQAGDPSRPPYQSNFKKPGARGLRPRAPGLKTKGGGQAAVIRSHIIYDAIEMLFNAHYP